MGFTRKITPEQRAEYEKIEDQIAKDKKAEADKTSALKPVQPAPKKKR